MNYFFILCIFYFNFVAAERLHEQIYSPIEGSSACFRRLNGTHQTGCSSPRSGSVGVVQMVNNISDAQWIVFNGTESSYIAVVSTSLFHTVIEIFMENPQLVGGILVYQNSNETVSFSQDSRCPNEYFSAAGSECSTTDPKATKTWNEFGTGLMRRNIPFPIFFVPESQYSQIEKINSCYERFNLDKNNEEARPLCSVQLNSFMFAAVNSEVCLRRSAISAFMTPTRMCDPLGDQNVYYSIFPRTKEQERRPVILVTARLDSASLFDDLSPGAASSVIGSITVIAAAATLAKMTKNTDAAKYSHNVIWTLLNGEAFDYIGSQRIAYDISRGKWPPNKPLATSDIDLHVEIGQIGAALNIPGVNDNPTWPLFAYMPYEINSVPDKVSKFTSDLKENLNKYNLQKLTNVFTKNIPPSSLHSFRRILRNVTDNGSLPELLVADHGTTFVNKYYNSAMDNAKNVGFVYKNITIDDKGTFIKTKDLILNGTMTEKDMQVKIAHLATALANTLYQQIVQEPYNGDEEASAHLIDEMLYCYLSSQSCRLLSAAEFGSGTPPGDGSRVTPPAPLYVGVSGWAGAPAVFGGHLVAILTGDQLVGNKTLCNALRDSDYNHYWLRGWNHTGVCIRTTMNFTSAVSPAFFIEDYDLKSGEYSSWTESIWQGMSARVFVSAGGLGAKLAAPLGLLATILAAIVTHWLKAKHAILFPDPGNTTASSDVTTGILRTVNC